MCILLVWCCAHGGTTLCSGTLTSWKFPEFGRLRVNRGFISAIKLFHCVSRLEFLCFISRRGFHRSNYSGIHVVLGDNAECIQWRWVWRWFTPQCEERVDSKPFAYLHSRFSVCMATSICLTKYRVEDMEVHFVLNHFYSDRVIEELSTIPWKIGPLRICCANLKFAKNQ